MLAIAMIIGGGLLIVSGLVIYVRTAHDQDQAPVSISKTKELERAIEMSVADGVFTNNERKLLEKLAGENDLNPSEVIAQVNKQISERQGDSETEIIDLNKKNGDDFEKFVAQKFNKKYFQIKEWAGDKYIKGTYATTTYHPDLRLEFKLKDIREEFSVECKWRRKTYNGGIEIAHPKQWQRYKDYARIENIPVFIAIGIGGKGGTPEHLFTVPLREISKSFIPTSELKKYERDLNHNFFYDYKNKKLE